MAGYQLAVLFDGDGNLVDMVEWGLQITKACEGFVNWKGNEKTPIHLLSGIL